MADHSDTIAAITTASGAAGVGVVRVSGPRAMTIAQRLTGRPPRPGRMAYRRFHDATGASIDDGVLLAFLAPHSYTGEDVVELQAHGSPVLLAALVQRCCALGARPARAGEFTERAFLNGKLDLAQAEAVADLIAASSEAAARAARRSLDGVFSRQCNALADAMTALRIHVEAAIDFPEEEIDFLSDSALQTRLDAVQQQMRDLLHAAQRGQRLRDGLHVVIVGPPNVGKSSLLNALAGSERAIVTELAGTTRDVLREVVRIDGIEITLVDTAGLRESKDAIEREGIRRAHQELASADLALIVSDDSVASRIELPALAVQSRLYLHNKCDLSAHPAGVEPGRDGHIWVSAHTGAGLDALRDALRNTAGYGESTAGACSARARHVDALHRAEAHLAAARECVEVLRAGELAAEELRLAHHAIAEITGAVSADDLLGQIFAGFCIGK